MKYKNIKEETHIEFKNYKDLSYYDDGNPKVKLCINDKPIGYAKVWKDSEQLNREYILINYEVLYLDTITLNKN